MDERPAEERSGEETSAPPPPPPPPPASRSADDHPVVADGVRPAPLGGRIAAYVLDAIGIAIVTAIIGSLIPPAAASVLQIVIVLGYFGYMESTRGQTFGKQLVRIRVIGPDGGHPDLSRAVLRRVPFVLGTVIGIFGGLAVAILGAMVSFAIAVALLVTVITDKPWNRGLHDKLADTTVVTA